MSSRSSELISSIPIGNRSLMGLCLGCYLYQVVFDPPIVHYTLCPRNVLYLNEWYRLITSALFHGSPMHIGMNMMAVYGIGSALERRLGTSIYVLTSAWGVLLTGLVYVAIAWCVSVVPTALLGGDDLMYQHSVGLSGVVFQLSVIECRLRPETSRSVLGLATVPAPVYPWVLLVVLQVLMPNLSFVGHLSGVLVGEAQARGAHPLPSSAFVRAAERARRWTETPGFAPTPDDDDVLASDPSSSLTRTIGTGATAALRLVRNVAETVRVCLFGRADSTNDGGGDRRRRRPRWGHDDDDDDAQLQAAIVRSLSPSDPEEEARLV